MSNGDSVRTYGAKIDPIANAFLTKEPSDMYDMLRYFMGYTDEHFTPITGATGKRFRPAVLLAIADGYGCLDDAMPAALSIELFHNFSLIHDDIEDNDELRRGRPTVWKVWGVNKAINAGDAQLVLALEALATMPANSSTYRALQSFLLARYREVIEGQHLDFSLTEANLANAEVTEVAYLKMIDKKSAALIGATTATAGYIAGQSQTEIDALETFGREFGMAYQLFDDVQSLWATTAQTGKTPAGDIEERKKTLPIIRARDVLGTKQQEFLAYYADTKASTETILALVEETDALAYTNAKITGHKSHAYDALARTSLPQEKKEQLMDFGNSLVS